MILTKKGVYQFNIFQNFPQLVHGFSTRQIGSLTNHGVKNDSAIQAFASTLAIKEEEILFMEQVHEATISKITSIPRAQLIHKTDGMVTSRKNVFLCVRSADCIPLLLFDPKNNIVGAVHVGWKGAVKNITACAINEMRMIGARSEDIIAGLGPSIRSCCYKVDEERVKLFSEQFPDYHDRIIEMKGGSPYLSLQDLVKMQLLKEGITEEHVEDGGLCTFDNAKNFFSYRKKDTVPFGLMGGIIGVHEI